MCAFHTERVLNCMLEPGKITRVYIMAIIVFFFYLQAPRSFLNDQSIATCLKITPIYLR